MINSTNLCYIKYNLSLIEAFNYPAVIRNHLRIVVDNIVSHLESTRVYSIILYGSAPRGELSYKVNKKNGTVELFSDYELWVVTDKWPRFAERNRLNAALSQLAGKLGTNSLFHIDVTINPVWLFELKGRLEKRLMNYETRETGVTLAGRNFLSRMPRINLRTLDFGNLNELVLVRLWMQLLHTPPDVVRQSAEGNHRHFFAYTLARNILEIPTIFLPHEGVLLPGYRQRVRHFLEHFSSHPAFPHEFSAVLEESLSMKLTLDMRLSIMTYYKWLIAGYRYLIKYLANKYTNPPYNHTVKYDYDGSLRYNPSLFKAKLIPELRRKRNEVRLLRIHRHQRSLSEHFRWLKRDKHPAIIEFLFCMHETLYNQMQRRSCESFLQRAEALLTDIEDLSEGHTESVGGGSIADRWLFMRKRFIKFMSGWFYGKHNASEFFRISNWAKEKG